MAADLRRDHHRPGGFALLVPLVVLLAGCDLARLQLDGRASEAWTRTYPLAEGGEIEIVNTNGRIEVEGADVRQVEVRAERIVRAATDDAARTLLPRLRIEEQVSPDRIRLETGRVEGISIGVQYEVRYLVRAPRSAAFRITSTNGAVSAAGTSGPLSARTTNGSVKARGISGGLSAQTTNGAVEVDLAAVTAGVSLQTTNGAVELTVPDEARADLTATCTNGGITVSGLKLETTENSRRRLEGRINGGGAAIEVRTTNGGIRVRSRSSAA